MATAKQKAWRAKFARIYGGGKKKRTQTKRGFKMAKGRKKRSSGRRFYGGGTMLNSAFEGAGIAALSKRFAPQLLGQYTGVGAAAAYAMFAKKNITGLVVGAGIHDFIGNVGAASGVSSGVQIYS